MPRSAGSDDELIQQAIAGDRQAFDHLMQRYEVRITHVVSRYLTDSSEVADLLQDIFIRAFKALKDFRGDSQFYTWLYRIAINTAKNHRVVQQRNAADNNIEIDQAVTQLTSSRLRDFATPENILARDEIEKVVNQTMDAMAEEIRMTLILREIDGLSYTAIAQIMGCPIGTVRSRLSRARELLETKIRPLISD